MASYNFNNYSTVKVNGTNINTVKFNGSTIWTSGVTSASISKVSFTGNANTNTNHDYSYTFPTKLRKGSIRIRAYMHHGANPMPSLRLGNYTASVYTTLKLYNGNTLLGTKTYNHSHGQLDDSYTIDKTINTSESVTRIWYRHQQVISFGGSANSYITTTSRMDITSS